MCKCLNRLGISCSTTKEMLAVGGGSLVLLLLFFAPFFVHNSLIYSGDFGSSDLLELNIPRRILAVQAMRQGHLPLWEPKLSNGLPLFAEGQTGVFNPLNIGYYFLCNPTLATNLAVVTTLLIALLGCYWLARRLGAEPLPAWLGALAFALGGVFIFRLRNLNTIHTAAYLPWILALWHGYLRALARRQRCAGWLVGFGVVLSLQILSGHPHMTYLCWLVGACMALLWLFADTELAEGRSRAQMAGLAVAHILIMVVASVLLCAVQLFPTYELSQLASRSQPYTWETLKEYPFTMRDLERLVYPYCFGNPALGSYERSAISHGVFWEVTAYLGIIPLLFSLSTLALLSQRKIQMLWGGAVFFLVASLGPQGFLYGLFWKLCPGFNLFRCPSRFLLAFSLIMAILAALGCQHWLQVWQERKHVSSRWVLVLIALTILDLGWISYAYQTEIPSTWQNVPPARELIGTAPKVYTPTYFQSWQDCIGARGWRNAQEMVMSHRNLLNPDLAAIWGVAQNGDSNVIDGGLSLREYRDLQMYQLQQVMSSLDDNSSLAFNADLITSLREQGVTHVMSYLPFRNATKFPDLLPERIYSEPAFQAPALHIYPIAKPLPKVRLVLALCEDPTPYMQTMFAMFKEAPQHGYYEITDVDLPQIGVVQNVEERPNSIVIDCSCLHSCALIITQSFCPGWSARVDGREVSIARVNHAFQGIALEAGKHHVELTYSPLSFAIGWRVSLSTLIFLAFAGCWSICKVKVQA